jgi:hypothetical protein
MPNLKHPSPRSSGKVLRSRWRRWIGLGAVLPFLMQLVGCGEDAAALPIACSGDNYCPPARSSAWWAIQLWPTETGDKVGADPHWLLTPQEGQSLSFDGTGSAQLRFRAAALLSGLVQTADNRALVRARVQATLPSAIPGQNDYRFDTQTAEKVAGTYSLRIPTPAQPDDQLYRFWVGFDDASQASMYPPMWLEHPVTGDLELPIQLRPATQLAVLSGRITNPLGEGVGGMSVQVFDENNQLVSSSAVSLTASGVTGGTYRAVVDPSLAKNPRANLRVVVRPGPTTMGLPSLEAVLAPPMVGTEKIQHFMLPSQRKPVQFMLPVSGLGPSGATQAVTAARVIAQVHLEDATTPSGVRVLYTTQADTDSQGIAKLMLVPAPSGGGNLTYHITIVSPPRTPYASLSRDIQIGPSEGLLAAVTLPSRPRLMGRLLSAFGEPVSGGQVVAQPIVKSSGPTSPLDSAPEPTLPQTITDSDGRFVLRLDPGDYDLDMIPQLGTGPRTSLDNQRIGDTDIDLGEVRLPRIALAKMLVVGPTALPAPQVKVRVLELPNTSPRYGLACTADLPCSQVAKVRAEAFTDSKGRVQVLLPDSSPTASFLPHSLR